MINYVLLKILFYIYLSLKGETLILNFQKKTFSSAVYNISVQKITPLI